MHEISLGIVSDEITLEFRKAAEYGTSWGISLYEIRCLQSGRVPNVERSEIADVLQCVKEKNIRITALSPGIFKHQLSKQHEIQHELTDVLPRTIALAKELGAPLIIVFGFQREQGEPQAHFELGVKIMKAAADLAQKAGLTLAIENEPGFWCDSGANTAKFIRTVNSPALGANWDPCNGYGTSEKPYPDGYNALKELIFNVHAKDTKRGALIECVPVGEGAVDWAGQVEALVREKRVSHITIETHCLPLVEKSKQNVETLRRMIQNTTISLKATV